MWAQVRIDTHGHCLASNISGSQRWDSLSSEVERTFMTSWNADVLGVGR